MIIYESNLKQARIEIGGIIQRIKENAKQRKNRQDSMQVIGSRKKECSRWDVLHELIGSADGTRNSATLPSQGLTFELMTALDQPPG